MRSVTTYVLSFFLLLTLVGTVPANAQFERDWEFSASQGNNPDFIGTDRTARGLAYGTVDDGNGNMVERVFVATGGGANGDPFQIKVLDANDGTDTGTSLSGVSGLPSVSGGRKITDVGVSDDGIIIACNEVNNKFISDVTEDFKCWRWDDLQDSPTNIIDFTPPDNSDDDDTAGDWVGRQFTVVGSAADNTLTLMTSAVNNSVYVYRFTTSDNGQSFSAEGIQRQDRPPVSNVHGVAPKGPGDSKFLFNEGTTQPRQYSSSGSEEAADPGIFSNFTWPIKFFEAASQDWLVAFNWESDGGQRAELGNITNGIDQPGFFGETPSLGSQSNANGTGDVDLRLNDDNTVTVFVLSTNNGIGAYTTTDEPLPVELASFTGAQTGSNAVELQWVTASETNNAGFRVQHRAPTADDWSALGFVESAASDGTTNQSQEYRFRMKEDLAPGSHRFRLKQVDLDGSTNLSDVVTVDISMQEVLQLSAPAPNPAHNEATVSFAVQEATEAAVNLYNVLGQQVATLYRGTLPAEQQRTVQVKTDDLSSGVYIVRMEANGQSKTQRLTVVR